MALPRREFIFLLGAAASAAPLTGLVKRWQDIAALSDGTVGIAALDLTSGEAAGLHGADHFPLASVCKLPIALHIFAMVDEGKLSRSASIEIPRGDLVPGVSPIAERWAKQKSFPLDEVLELMIAKSDNTAVETLYRMGGGGAAITARLRAWQIDGMRIDRSERECGRDAAASITDFIADPRDSATPDATVRLLQRLYRGELLSRPSTARIIQMMQATTTGPARIKGLLPPGTVVAHKTGTAWTVKGLNGSTNDVGVITRSNRAGQVALAVYVKASRQKLEAREKIIALVAQSVVAA